MSDEQIRLQFQGIRQQISARQAAWLESWDSLEEAFEDLQVMYEQMQTHLDAAEAIEDVLMQQNQLLAERYRYYYDLFQFSPIANVITDPSGVILDANQAIADLLNVPQRYLIGKPIVLYVAENDRLAFHTKLSQIAHSHDAQTWRIQLFPRKGTVLATEWQVAIARNSDGQLVSLRIGIHNLAQQAAAKLPQSLDGLRVLVVDDEPDIREFITAVLESCGVGVRTVESAAAALEAIPQFQPDVLISDIRMPDGDGYQLIQRIRAIEAEQGGHLPAAAITAYLDEDREKSLSAGFEAHLHKLAQPAEWIEMIAQLAR